VLDDLNVLHQIKDGQAQGDAYLFAPEPAYRTSGGGGFRIPAGSAIGENSPVGAVVWFYLKDAPKGEVTLEFLDGAGKLVRKYSSKSAAPAAAASSGDDEGGGGGGAVARLTPTAGLNRFVWDLRHEDAVTFPGMILWSGFTRGPKAAPGKYQVKFTVDGKAQTREFEIRKDPRLKDVSAEDLAKQLALSLQGRDKLSETHQGILRIRDARKQVEEMTARLDAKDFQGVIEAGKALNKKLTAIEQQLYQTKNQSSQDPLNYPIMLNNRLAALLGVIQSADAAPTRQSQMLYEELASAINGHLSALRTLLDKDLAEFNKLARDKSVPPVILKKNTP
jgi:hypothetical protein